MTKTVPTTGKLEVTIKISSIPVAETIENNWKRFQLRTEEGLIISLTVRPKAWRTLETANEQYPSWVAAIRGRIGSDLSNQGFTLEDPNIQVFEKKPKEAKSENDS